MKFSIDQVRKIFKDANCTLLSDEYVNAHQKLAYICECGNTSEINLNNFKGGKRCKQCGSKRYKKSRSHDFEYVKKLFEDANCKLLSTEYVNTHTKMEYICECGNQSEIALSKFQSGQRCSRCRYRKSSESLSFDYNCVKKYFEDKGCKLLEKEYINARTKMKYICECGNQSEIVFDSFKRGNRCKTCGINKNSQMQLLTQEEVKRKFDKCGCKLLEEKYINSRTKVKCLCKCGKVIETTPNNVWNGKKCVDCGIEKRSGSNHYGWKKDRLQHKLDNIFRQRSYKLIKMVLNSTGGSKNKRSYLLLGYTYKELQNHIISHPNWENVKDENWHIDHIFPIKAFLDKNIRDLKIINSLDNLQPLLAIENLSKNAKYDKEEFEKYLLTKGVSYAS